MILIGKASVCLGSRIRRVTGNTTTHSHETSSSWFQDQESGITGSGIRIWNQDVEQHLLLIRCKVAADTSSIHVKKSLAPSKNQNSCISCFILSCLFLTYKFVICHDLTLIFDLIMSALNINILALPKNMTNRWFFMLT